MPSIKNSDLIAYVLDNRMPAEKAVERSRALGLDHNEIALFFGLEVPGKEDETKMPKIRRVTAKAMPHKDPEGRAFPYMYAGRCAWSRDPLSEGTTHDLSEPQYQDVLLKKSLGGLFIIRDLELADGKPVFRAESEVEPAPVPIPERANAKRDKGDDYDGPPKLPDSPRDARKSAQSARH